MPEPRSEAMVAYEAECASWLADGFRIVVEELHEKKSGCTVSWAIWKRAGWEPLDGELRVMVTEDEITDEDSGFGVAFAWRMGAVCPLIESAGYARAVGDLEPRS